MNNTRFSKITTTQGQDHYILEVINSHFDEFVSEGKMAREIADELVKQIANDLKPEIMAEIKKNLSQLVKDVGADVTVAGLRYLLKTKK